MWGGVGEAAGRLPVCLRRAGCQPDAVPGACQGNLPSPAPQNRGHVRGAAQRFPVPPSVKPGGGKKNSALKCAGTELGAAASGGCGRASKPREEMDTSPPANLRTSKIQQPLVLKPIL